MTDPKPQNYSDAQTAALLQAYASNTSVEALATLFNKTTKSIVAKLAREGVYKPAAAVKQPSRTKKADLVTTLSQQLGIDRSVLETLEKANHEALEALVTALA